MSQATQLRLRCVVAFRAGVSAGVGGVAGQVVPGRAGGALSDDQLVIAQDAQPPFDAALGAAGGSDDLVAAGAGVAPAGQQALLPV